jgi:hypothetical protein
MAEYPIRKMAPMMSLPLILVPLDSTFYGPADLQLKMNINFKLKYSRIILHAAYS